MLGADSISDAASERLRSAQGFVNGREAARSIVDKDKWISTGFLDVNLAVDQQTSPKSS